MSYYRGYGRGRHSSYGRRRGNRGGGSGNPFVLLIVLIVVGVVMTGGKIFAEVFPLAVFVVIIYGLYKLILHFRSSSSSTDSSKQNEEKHTTREYFTGTNDGENIVARSLARGLSFEKYYILNNITIPSQYNGSSQIDHIVVSRFGIFVIETKDYKGWIFGSSDQEKWTQSLPGGNNKFQFHNPLRQNWAHIQSLKGIFPTVPEDKFISIIVFTDASEFKTPLPNNVVNIEGLVPLIASHQEHIVTEDMLYTVVGKLTYRGHTNNISAQDHIENLNTRHLHEQELN